MYIVTGKTGTPHVNGADDAAFNAGVAGLGDWVLSNKALTAVQSANGQVQLGSAEIVIDGVHARIETNEVATVSPADPGMKRIDVIVARYERTSAGIESVSLAVVQGTPAASGPAVPTIRTGSLYNGATQRDMALVQVAMDASNIESITVVARQLPALKDLVNAAAIPGDSGWINATLASGVAHVANDNVCYRKAGHTVQIAGTCSITGMDVDKTLFTLPAGYRPEKTVRAMVPMTGWGHAKLAIGTNGNVVLQVCVSQTGAKMTGTIAWVAPHVTFTV